MDSSWPELVIFDVETIIETEAIIEFGAIIVCPQTLVEKEYFSSLVRPRDDLEFGIGFQERRSGLNREDIISSHIFFSDIAHPVYDMLDGRIWVGHNIKDFDCRIVKDAFHEIGRLPPEPSGVIDTMELCEPFRGEAGNVQMATLAKYFGLGEQKHSLDDVRLNLRLFQRCAAVFFLRESKLLRAQFGNTDSNKVPRFLEPEEYAIPSLIADYYSYDSFDRVRDVLLPISCSALIVKLGPRSWDNNGRPKVSFVVYAPDNLSTMLDECDRMLQRLFQRFGINSEWRNVVVRAQNSTTVRLSIANTADKQTIVCNRTDSGETRRLVLLETLLPPGTKLDAYFFLETYDYQGSAGIRLVAYKLITHP